MEGDQLLIIGILCVTMVMFLWGRWRHDMVAVGALLACVVFGLVSPTEAFYGFGHPAVITVACVLVLSRSLQTSGAIDVLARHALPQTAGPTLSLTALTALGALLSAFMNNVGALALLMPLALKIAARHEMPPGRMLMPLAFGTILGGMTTLIGTPPNLIVAGFRSQTGHDTFVMFDFSPVGVVVALAGIAFISLVGWRLVPDRKQTGIEGFETGAYITEARVTEKSRAAGKTLREIDQLLDEAGAQIISMVRNEVRLVAPSPHRLVHAGDILVIEADAGNLANALSALGLQLEEAVKKASSGNADDERSEQVVQQKDIAAGTPEESGKPIEASGEAVLMELALLPQSALANRSASDIHLRTHYGINLLAVSRRGQRSMSRLRTFSLRPGDLLLVQGPPEMVTDFAADFACVPLAERELRIPDKRKAMLSALIMMAAVCFAAFGLLPASVSFTAAVLASMALHTVSPRAAYEAID